MRSFLRNALALVAGLLAGGVLNLALIRVGGSVIPPPGGADVTTLEGLRASIHLFAPKHFLFPFLAHAAGTLVGAAVAARIAAGRPRLLAMVIGLVFLAGGLANVLMLPAPMWFNVLDLVVAYLPMAWLGSRLGARSDLPPPGNLK